MRAIHLVSPYDELSTRNGSAVLRIARELTEAALQAGSQSVIIGGRGRLAGLPHCVAALRLRAVDPKLPPRLRDTLDNCLKFGLARSYFAPRLYLADMPFEPTHVIHHNLPWTRLSGLGSAENYLYVHNRIMLRSPAWVIRRRLRSFERIICVSDYIRSDLLQRAGLPESGQLAERCVTIRNGVSVDRVNTGAPAKKWDVIFVGRLVPEKGAAVLLKAVSQIAQVRHVSALVVGGQTFLPMDRSSPYESQLHQLASCVPNAEITFLGAVPPHDVQRLMRSARTVVVPSIWPEPFGLTTIEGLASGSPTIATATGGTLEFPSASGIELVPPEDPETLAAAILRFLDDAELADQRGTMGSAWASSQTWSEVWDAIRSL